MQQYTFEDMQKMDRAKLGNMVPLELFRTIRLIGMNQGLPMGAKAQRLLWEEKSEKAFRLPV